MRTEGGVRKKNVEMKHLETKKWRTDDRGIVKERNGNDMEWGKIIYIYKMD